MNHTVRSRLTALDRARYSQHMFRGFLPIRLRPRCATGRVDMLQSDPYPSTQWRVASMTKASIAKGVCKRASPLPRADVRHCCHSQTPDIHMPEISAHSHHPTTGLLAVPVTAQLFSWSYRCTVVGEKDGRNMGRPLWRLWSNGLHADPETVPQLGILVCT